MKRLSFLFLVACLVYLPTRAQKAQEAFYFAPDSVKIHYETEGSGYPILLIHGFSSRGNDWKRSPLYEGLLDKGFMVITVDLRGNGLSDKPHTPEAYLNDAEAKDLIGLLYALGIEHYSAVGYSRGSIILARLLVLDERIEQAVIGGMGADFTNPNWPRRIFFYNALMNDSIPGFDEFRKRIKSEGLDQLALAYQQNGQPSTSPQELARVKQPVLVVCGDHDQDNGNGRDLAKLLPNASFKEVAGTHPSVFTSKEFSKECLRFLKNRKP